MAQNKKNSKKFEKHIMSPVYLDQIKSQIFNSVECSVLILGSDYGIEWHNDYFLKWSHANHLNSNNLIDKKASDIFPFWEDLFLPMCEKSLNLKQPISFDHQVWISNAAHILKGHILDYSQNGTQKIIIVFHDISEWIKSSEAFYESQEKYKVLIENVPAAISLFNYKGELLFINRQGAQSFNENPDQLIDRTMWELFPKEVADRHMSHIRKVLDTGKGYTVEAETFLKGKTQKFMINLQPFHDTRGKVTAVLVIASDITESRNAKERLRQSEAKYQLLFENVPAAISLFNNEGELLFINNIGAQTLGRSQEELIGLTQWDLFPKKIADRQMANIREVMKSGIGTVIGSETVVNKLNRCFSTNLQPYRDSSGEITAALVIASDITEQKTAEENLRKSEEKYRLLIDNIQVLIAIIDYNGKFTYINDFGASLQNRTPEEIIGKTLKDILPKEFVGERLPKIREVIDTGKGKITEAHLVMDGYDAWYETIMQPYLDAAGKIESAMIITTEITDRKKAAIDLQQNHEELEKRVKERTRELANANEQLNIERRALNQKNIALKEVLNQIEEGKQQVENQIQANVNKILMPILDNVQDKPPESIKAYINIIRDTLADIAAPFANQLDNEYSSLTPREVEVCTLIKNGMTCKQIALSLSISPQTVLKQRTIIRKKLGINNRKVNLASYLQSMK